MKYILAGEETNRLKFRLLKPDDFNLWLNLFKGTEVARFLGFGHLKTAEEQCRLWFDIQEKRYKNDLGGMNVLVEKASGKMIGQCGLLIQEVKRQEKMEIGYSVLPRYWGKGFAPEAAQKCRDFAFQNNFTNELISIIHVENFKSENVAIKNGMKKTIQTTYKEMPVNIFRITKDEWIKLPGNNRK